MFGYIKQIIIFPDNENWVAKEIRESGLVFYGRGKTPKEAFGALDKTKEDFEKQYFVEEE